MKIMDWSTNFLYQVNLVIFLFFAYCHPGASGPVEYPVEINNTLDAITACDSVKFLRNSAYISQCAALSYPVEFKEQTDKKDIAFMCMTLIHITNKTCEYHVIEQSQMKIPETAEKFDEEMKKLEPSHDEIPKVVEGWCQNMPAFLNASIQNDTNKNYTKYANETILDKVECIPTCHIHHGVNHFCVVFYWFSKLYNTLPLPKDINITKEVAVTKQEAPHAIKPNDNVEKPLPNPDNKNEHTSIVDTKAVKEQPKSQASEVEIQSNLKTESKGSADEQEIKNLEQPDPEEKLDKETQRQDAKLPPPIDDKSNIVENPKIENPKPDYPDGNIGLLDEDGKKGLDEGVEGENGIMDTNKKDSYDAGDQRGYLESPVIKEEDESHFFMYFSMISFACILLYIGYHNKQKILAMLLEGRQSRRSRGSRRRPNTANYRKLDSNLEEAVTSQCNSNVTHVIY